MHKNEVGIAHIIPFEISRYLNHCSFYHKITKSNNKRWLLNFLIYVNINIVNSILLILASSFPASQEQESTILCIYLNLLLICWSSLGFILIRTHSDKKRYMIIHICCISSDFIKITRSDIQYHSLRNEGGRYM